MAFEDRSPATNIHYLIIPKHEHLPNVDRLKPIHYELGKI